jgi:hypothetical protein
MRRGGGHFFRVCVRSAKLAGVTDGSGRRGSVARFLRTARGRLTVVPPSGSVLPAQIDGVDASTAAFVGTTASGASAAAVEVRSLVDHDRAFGSADGELRRSVRLFFDNGGRRAFVAGTTGQLSDGLDLLNNVRFSVLAIPDAAGLDPAAENAVQERRGSIRLNAASQAALKPRRGAQQGCDHHTLGACRNRHVWLDESRVVACAQTHLRMHPPAS